MSIFIDNELWNKFYNELLSWENTPYWDNQKVKGQGVDCVRFVGETFSTLKEDFDYKKMERVISPQWWKNVKEQLLYNTVKEILDNHNIGYYEFDYIKGAGLFRGDFLLYSIRGKIINHIAVYVGDNKIIHASVFKKKVVIEKFNDVFLQKVIRITEI